MIQETTEKAGLVPAFSLSAPDGRFTMPRPARLARRLGVLLLRGALAMAASTALAQDLGPPLLDLPVDCVPGTTCHIQNFVDSDPGPAAQDFTCGPLTYDGHKGTDFGLPTLRAMAAGVNVVAAAPGVVRGMRDGMEDRLYRAEHAETIKDRECGNGVVIRHAGGWETQYCHLKRGSVTVRSGDRVAAGDVLGQIGLSGRTQFPHLHLSLREGDRVVDPFAPEAVTCGGPAQETLWRDKTLALVPGGLIGAGFWTAVPEYADVKAGTMHSAEISRADGALVVWVHAFGTRQGDVITLRIDGPDGLFYETRQTLEKTRAQMYRAGGRRMKPEFPDGPYRGEAILSRDGVEIGRITASTLLTR
ncbi:M23 family metallopeptidase [Pseudooceanicola aestuarii]|uniref:M23 family metallopeptidase n=1 Tax=Pseudooceanicola aestuarii TaxID=2697319 RepID=UPI001EF812CA|nr:M23 family metallopeptidase [Pseudooceanicola aestuarii]